MRSISSVLTALLIVAALAAPSALARPAQDPPSPPRHALPGPPTWPKDPQPIARAATQPAPSDDGFPWDIVGIALVAVGAGLIGALAVVRVRLRTHLAA